MSATPPVKTPLWPGEMHSALEVERAWILFPGLCFIIFCASQLLFSASGWCRAGWNLRAAVHYGNRCHWGTAYGSNPMATDFYLTIFFKNPMLSVWSRDFSRHINTAPEDGCAPQKCLDWGQAQTEAPDLLGSDTNEPAHTFQTKFGEREHHSGVV